MSEMFSTDEIPTFGSVVYLYTTWGDTLRNRPVVMRDYYVTSDGGTIWEFRELSKDHKTILKTRRNVGVKNLAGWSFAHISINAG